MSCQFVQRINLPKQEEIKEDKLENELYESGKMQQKCRALIDAHRVCKSCGSYNKRESCKR